MTKTLRRDVEVRSGEFKFYFRRSFHCFNCDVDWWSWT